MKKETLCVQAGYEPKSGEARITPICQSTTFYYEKSQDITDLFDLKKEGFFYSRLANPTLDVLEKKVAALEGGSCAVACSSGMSAIFLSVLNLCEAGDNLICSNAVYGGTYNLFSITLKKYGIETRFIDPDIKEIDLEKLIDDNTKLIYGETVANPNINVLDFEKFAGVCKKYKIVFIVDNTLASPIFCKPLSLGANVVVHSSSKYLDGHAAALGGIIVDGGNFKYKDNNRYKGFNEPDSSYNGLIYSDLGKCAFGIKTRVQLIRDIGAIMSPQNAFITNLGCETLALRMERHNSNAVKIAEFLQKHKQVKWVKHPSLKSNKEYIKAQKYLPKGSTGMLSFAIKGEVKAFIDRLSLIASVTHIADVRSSIIHPASTTHKQIPVDKLEDSGISADLIRLSVGIENIEDLINDLKLALEG